VRHSIPLIPPGPGNDAWTAEWDDDEPAEASAEAVARRLRAGLEQGQGADGRPLPPLPASTVARRVRDGIPDTTTPAHATGEMAESIRTYVAGDGRRDVEMRAKGGALERYGEDKLMGVPPDADADIDEVLEDWGDEVLESHLVKGRR
jgi:hypothetical protein